MGLINLNTYPAAGTINDTDKVIINGQQYNYSQLQAYIAGETGTFSGTEQILKVNKNTGRGTMITLAQMKDFVAGSSSPVTESDIFPIIASGTYKHVTSSVAQSYLDTFDLNSISGLQVWYDSTDNSTLTVSGSDVTQVRDKSGNNNHSNPSGAKPTKTTESTTGKQVINMDPSDSGLPLTTGISASTFTIFIVYKILIPTGSTVLLGGASPNNNYITTDDSVIGVGGAGAQTYLYDRTMKEMAVMCIRQQSGSQQIWEYNGRQRLRTTGSVPSNPFYMNCIGALNNGSWAGGKFAGFAYYNSFLSDSDALRVAKKLAQTHNVNPGPYNKIVAFGDSYTVGIGASTNNGWAFQVAASLGKNLANEGISGSRFQDVTGTDTNSGYNRYHRNLIEFPTSDRLYILYGFNDITQIGASASQYQTMLTTMANDLIAAGYSAGSIYIGTVPRMYGDANSSTVQAYGDAARAVCSSFGFHCAEVYAAQVANGGDSLFSGDHLHPNDTGHTVIANAFLAA
jgi:lysophospholipase L1-like esterase